MKESIRDRAQRFGDFISGSWIGRQRDEGVAAPNTYRGSAIRIDRVSRRNIDHRRVPTLQTYFRRRGARLPISRDADDYLPGDLVTWTLPGNLPHIGLVTDQRSPGADRWLIVHNIGRGPELEDMLFAYPISGHYRYPED